MDINRQKLIVCSPYRLRLDMSYTTLNAMQNVMLHAGAKGYLRCSEASRTLRERYFVSLITPIVKTTTFKP